MALEGTYRGGVVVLDPGSLPIPDGTRVEVAPRTGMEPLINKTPGVCGGDARIGNWRIGVWLLEEARRGGVTDAELMTWYPGVTAAELAAAWEYARRNPAEIEHALWFNTDSFAHVEDAAPPLWVLARGKALGIPDADILEAFTPPADPGRLAAAWAAYQADPALLTRRDR
jgi:uncharacterized protein (DUF433 family)